MKKNIILNLTTILAFILFFGIIYLGFFGDIYRITGNIHDTFIPLNSGHAWIMGEQFSETFHSPFGIIYHLMNYIALSVTLEFPDYFNALDIFNLVSILFSIFLFLLFALMRFNQPTGSKMPLWLLFFCITLVFQFRNPDSFGEVKLFWYGTYNFQLWAMLILQIAHSFIWTKSDRSNRDIVLFGVIQAICLAVCFNYKITFFAASGLICLAPLLLMSGKRAAIYVVSGIVSFLGFCAVTYLSGYSYSGYFADIRIAFESKQESPTVRPMLAFAFVLFVFSMQIVRHDVYGDVLREGKLSRTAVSAFLVKLLPYPGSRLLMFDMLVGLSILLAALGDFTRPVIFFVIVLFAFVFWKRADSAEHTPIGKAPYKLVLLVLTGVFLSKNILGVLIIANQKNWDGATAIDYDGLLRVGAINGHTKPLRFLVPDDTTFDAFTDGRLFEVSESWDDELVEASYSMFETRSSEKNVFDLNSNLQFIVDLNTQLAAFERLGIEYGTEERILNLGFVNPFPFLLGAAFPEQSFHWKHLGTTISLDDLNLYFSDMENSDFAVMPIASVDRQKQAFVNCSFYLWNHENGSNFIGYLIEGRALFFVTRDKALQYGLSQSFEVNIPDVREACLKVEKRFF